MKARPSLLLFCWRWPDCSPLAAVPRPQPTPRFLHAVLRGKCGPVRQRKSPGHVAIGPVSIPGYLDRPQLSCATAMTSKSSWPSSTIERAVRRGRDPGARDAVSASRPRKGLASPMRSQQPSGGALPWISPVLTVRPAASSRRRLEPREREREESAGTFCNTPLDGPDILAQFDGTETERLRPVRRGLGR